MNNKCENINTLLEVIRHSEDFNTALRAYGDNDQVKYFDGVSDTFSWHLYDLAKEKSLCVKETTNELMRLRIDIFKIFLELYPNINDDKELLSIVKSKLITKYFKHLGLGSEQLTFTAILLAFTEIYLSFNKIDMFMNYLLSSSNALGIVLANHSYVSYEELEKRTSAPIQKHTEEKKKIALPLADKIWSYDKQDNLLLRKQVAGLVVELLPDLNLTVNQVDNWLKKSDKVPPAILERYKNTDYGNSTPENKLRKQLLLRIRSELSPFNCESL
ncbi:MULTISPECIES: hypothetical protein [unclassified Psychrobacter]|uniref:hypothetical protein n=1 Tax=unclassified Psychrobacter TaxID=196806 RepID=UPI0025E65110|nr:MULTISPECIES: hypothetical protein [unclassified Psychrobacter]